MSILSRLIAASLGVWLISALPAIPDGIVNTGGASTAIIPGTTVVTGSCSANNLIDASGSPLTVNCLATANNGVLVTDSSGIPSIATTLPSALTYPAPTITGTITASGGRVNLTNGTSNVISWGTTGVANPGAGSAGAKLQLYGTAGTIGTGDYSIGVSSTTGIWLSSGNTVFTFYNNANFAASISIPAGNNQLQFGLADVAGAPSAQTMRVQSANGGINDNGATWTWRGSLSDGTGTSGDIAIQTGVKSNLSGVQATAANAIVIKGETQSVQLPQVTTGTPVASLCLDASNNIIKKTTAGSCI